jgi:putative cardiolipin synthase
MRIPSAAPPDTAGTRLGRALANPVAANPGKSGIYPLSSGRDAFAARVVLAAHADRTLDVQYYIWRADTTGQLLVEALWRAAERGVRVRMLLDDANVKGLDATVAALDAHPNIEVRLFNPFANRGMRLLEAIGDFSRINHRMHNKAFIADNQAAIVGGRNVGDEYFDAGSPVGFADLDVVAVGPVVKEASDEFDRYWNSESAYPVASLIAPAPPEASTSLREQWETLRQEPRSHDYLEAVRETELVQRLLEGRLGLEWAPAQIVADDPRKVLLPAAEIEKGVLSRLEHAMGRTMRELDLVSPYFVPGKEGTRELRALAGRGVQVRVLTNALAATDVGPVHAGYSKYREDLLRGGIRIYELKPGANVLKRDRQPDKGIGSSSSSLHAKTFGSDRNRIFVGSFNLDPRSANLNTEMGIVIDSAVLATRLSETLDTAIPLEAYELRLAATGSGLQWVERTAEGEMVHTTEPESSLLRRIWVRFLSILPIEWLL